MWGSHGCYAKPPYDVVIQFAIRSSGKTCSYFNLKSVHVFGFFVCLGFVCLVGWFVSCMFLFVCVYVSVFFSSSKVDYTWFLPCIILSCYFSNIPLWGNFIASGSVGVLLFHYTVENSLCILLLFLLSPWCCLSSV